MAQPGRYARFLMLVLLYESTQAELDVPEVLPR
jgi:hypothetical protein